jgi:hypothetical protein
MRQQTAVLQTALFGALLWILTALPAQGFAHNKIEFNNWWITAREDVFPNYLSATGNRAGDALFKVFPAEILERGENHRISGYQVAISIDDAYTGTYPVEVEVPAVQFFRTRLVTLAGSTYEVPDPAAPVGPRYDPVPVLLSSDNAWVIEVRFNPTHANPRLRTLLDVPATSGPECRGLAMVAFGRVGDRRASNVPGVVLQSSFAERHLHPGRASYSGSFSGGANTIAMFGTAGMPSATGELYFGLRTQQPTLQLAGPSAGGVVSDPQRFETQLGPGAYATDLFSRLQPGHVRLVVQGVQFDPGAGPPTHLALPLLVAVGAAGPTTTFDWGAGHLRIDPASLSFATLLIQGGYSGALVRVPAASGLGFDVDQPGTFNSMPLPVVPNSSVIGAQLWLQALVATTSLTIVATTNAVRLKL